MDSPDYLIVLPEKTRGHILYYDIFASSLSDLSCKSLIYKE